MAQEHHRRGLSSLPKWDGGSPWRIHRTALQSWIVLQGAEAAGAEWVNTAIHISLIGNAGVKAEPFRPGTDAFTNAATIQGYLELLQTIFQPEADSEWSRTSFKECRQGPAEDIASYIARKRSLWENAYPENQRAFSTYLDATIEGVSNVVIKRMIRRAHPLTADELRNIAVLAVANKRAAILGNYGESTTMDGLSSSIQVRGVQGTHQPQAGEQN